LAKSKTVYYCQNCGYQAVKWLGKCPSCAEWNSFVEELLQKNEPTKGNWRQSASSQIAPKPKVLASIEHNAETRIDTGDTELNRVLGGGLVPGSLILIGGEPGIGKSTLMLQLALSMTKLKTLYISGEESASQIKMRAERLGKDSSLCYILTETSTQNIFVQIEELEPDLVIVDSIQTLASSFVESSAGSVSQVRECTAELMKFAKESATPVFLVGHITKDGAIAGPKVLEHMVDTVLQFEGDRHLVYRLLRTSKNRFGNTSELGIYEMVSTGLKAVENPSEILISQRDFALSGVAIGTLLEGNRPMLIEIQSLVSPASYGTPQRSSTGFDAKRLNMLLAVLEKRGGLKLGNQDIFLNIAGGIRVEDPAIDLAVVASVFSSYQDLPIPSSVCFAAEIGLGGEIRAINRIEQRIAEAEKLGYKTIFVSTHNMKGLQTKKLSIKVIACSKLDDVFAQLFG
jgi:DNA repair protein RadA/Sms